MKSNCFDAVKLDRFDTIKGIWFLTQIRVEGPQMVVLVRPVTLLKFGRVSDFDLCLVRLKPHARPQDFGEEGGQYYHAKHKKKFAPPGVFSPQSLKKIN